MVAFPLYYPQSIRHLQQGFEAKSSQKVEHIEYQSTAELPTTSEDPPSLIILMSRDIPSWQAMSSFLLSGGGVIILEEGNSPTNELPEHPYIEWYPASYLTPQRWNFLLRQFMQRLQYRSRLHHLKSRSLADNTHLAELNELGVALSSERDLDQLLHLIADKAMKLTAADGCSLYLIESLSDDPPADGQDYFQDKQFRFRVALNYSRDISLMLQQPMNISRETVNGHVALTGKPVRIDDVYRIVRDDFAWGGRSFDEKHNYRTKSMLAVPMRNDRNEIIGVMQLINCKTREDAKIESPKDVDSLVIPFSESHVRLTESLASQASVAIKNAELLESIQILFDGFINASVKAIESRDPTTSGHSSRVATLTVAMAEFVSGSKTGPFAEVHYTSDQLKEVRYASLLHDFGKIGVREKVLIKSKKLYPEEQQAVMDRFRLIRMATELQMTRKQLNYLLERSREEAMQLVESVQGEMEAQLEELDEQLKFIIQCNEPTVLDQGGFEHLQHIAAKTFQHPSKVQVPYLTEDEMSSLSIPKGTLTHRDREEIESHVTHTYNFLRIIPWSTELSHVPEIAYAHHEKLNGTGYPRKLTTDEIPLQSKMMTIADIYDALTAWDRPYKKAIPAERALKILGFEAKDNHIDSDLLEIFINAKLYQLVRRPLHHH
jgi:HD-GYP domain-containing protein (c-di-GMP phosphodiesterase class II)